MNKVLYGDCRDTMRDLISQGVKAQMCVTSPPYYGLRSYLPNEHQDKALEIGLEQTMTEDTIDSLREMRYLSVCSGIEAASVAWGPLGWQAAAFSEIEPFPCAVLAHHYPDVPNLGDMTTIAQRILNGEVEATDVLAGGTPCQAFSVAGLRKSLADERGNLTLKFVEIADAIDFVRVRDGRPPAIVFWENVPGVLSTKDNAFGCFLAGLAGEDCELKPPGKRWADAGCVFGPQRAIAWRVLDAQYFGLAQRRRRVFVVASARDGFDPAAVLLEFDGVRRDSAPSREAGQSAATSSTPSATGCWWDGGQLSQTLDAVLSKGQTMPEKNRFPAVLQPVCVTGEVTHTLNAEGFDASEDGTGRGQPIVPAVLAFDSKESNTLCNVEVAPCLTTNGETGKSGGRIAAQIGMAVRRLTPRECERLQGFPDDYTLVPLPLRGRQTRVRWASDGARYKALGNSWAVPVVRWIGERINTIIRMPEKKGEQQ